MRHVSLGSRGHFAHFPSGTESMGDKGSKKAHTGPRTKFGCDRSIVVGCTAVGRGMTDRHPDRQTEWNDNKAHSLRT